MKRLNLLKKIKCRLFIILSISFLSFVSLNAQKSTPPSLQGKYFGQAPPGNIATLFAKDIISTPLYEHSAPAFSPDGKTVLWTVLEMGKPAKLLQMTMIGNIWLMPSAPPFADPGHDDFYPFFSVDGSSFSSAHAGPCPMEYRLGIFVYGWWNVKAIPEASRRRWMLLFQKDLNMRIQFPGSALYSFQRGNSLMESRNGKFIIRIS